MQIEVPHDVVLALRATMKLVFPRATNEELDREIVKIANQVFKDMAQQAKSMSH